MAVSFSSISGRVYPAWQSAFQASLEGSILHGSDLFKHLWKSLSCMAVTFSSMAVSFSSISGRVHPAWQSAFQASLEELSCMAVSFSSISGRVYPAWQSAFQASLEESILHGSELFKHLWKSLSCMAVNFSKHLWKSLSCMAVSFSSISGRVYPAWQSAFQASLEGSQPFQAPLEESILHGSELFKHLWDDLYPGWL